MLELHLAGDRREHGVIMAQPGARAGEEGHPALPHDDRPRVDQLAIAGLDAEALADAVAAVLDAAARLLVCHLVYSSFFVARGFLGAACAFVVVASLSALAVVFFGAAVLVSVVASALAFGSALAFAGAFVAVAFAFGSALTGLSAASFAASSASLAAWAAAASSSRTRSVLALSSACLASLA